MCALRAATADGRLRRSACGAQNLSRGARRGGSGGREEEDKIQEEPGQQLGVARTHHPSADKRTLVTNHQCIEDLLMSHVACVFQIVMFLDALASLGLGLVSE